MAKKTTKKATAFNANATAEAVANLFADAKVRVSTTRVSVRVKGQSRQVLGIVPGKGNTVEVSSPQFTQKSNASMTPRRNFNVITLKNPTQQEVVDLATAAYKSAGIL